MGEFEDHDHHFEQARENRAFQVPGCDTSGRYVGLYVRQAQGDDERHGPVLIRHGRHIRFDGKCRCGSPGVSWESRNGPFRCVSCRDGAIDRLRRLRKMVALRRPCRWCHDNPKLKGKEWCGDCRDAQHRRELERFAARVPLAYDEENQARFMLAVAAPAIVADFRPLVASLGIAS